MELGPAEVMRREIALTRITVGEVLAGAMQPKLGMFLADLAGAHAALERSVVGSVVMGKALGDLKVFQDLADAAVGPSASLVAQIAAASADLAKPYAESIALLSKAMSDAALRLPDGVLGQILAAESQRRTAMADFAGMATSYSEIIQGFKISPDRLLSLPAELVQGPSLEVELHGDLLDAFSIKDAKVVSRQKPSGRRTLEDRVLALNPDLMRMLDGARSALTSENPDKVRQAIISVRELLTHTLHLLAPDDRIEAWSFDKKEYAPNGRPTRRTRIQFICRLRAGALFEAFADADVKAALQVFDLCHEATHSLTQPFSAEQASVILARAEGLLNYWVELAHSS